MTNKRKIVAPFDITKLERCPYCGRTDIKLNINFRNKKNDNLWFCNYCRQFWED